MGGSTEILGDSATCVISAIFICSASQSCVAFIRGLLENVGAEIDPIRLIRRIKNGLEIPGLKPALIKILQDFNLQISLLEGCQAILHGDSADLAKGLHRDQTSGFLITCELSSASSVLRWLTNVISQDTLSCMRSATPGVTVIRRITFPMSPCCSRTACGLW